MRQGRNLHLSWPCFHGDFVWKQNSKALLSRPQETHLLFCFVMYPGSRPGRAVHLSQWEEPRGLKWHTWRQITRTQLVCLISPAWLNISQGTAVYTLNLFYPRADQLDYIRSGCFLLVQSLAPSVQVPFLHAALCCLRLHPCWHVLTRLHAVRLFFLGEWCFPVVRILRLCLSCPLSLPGSPCLDPWWPSLLTFLCIFFPEKVFGLISSHW